jgi:hypothetical protein
LRRPALWASGIWIAPAVLAMVQHVLQNRLEGAPPPPLRDLLFGGGDWLVYAFLTPPIFAVVHRWPIARPRIAARAALHFGVALLFCVAWTRAAVARIGLRRPVTNRSRSRSSFPITGARDSKRCSGTPTTWPKATGTSPAAGWPTSD